MAYLLDLVDFVLCEGSLFLWVLGRVPVAEGAPLAVGGPLEVLGWGLSSTKVAGILLLLDKALVLALVCLCSNLKSSASLAFSLNSCSLSSSKVSLYLLGGLLTLPDLVVLGWYNISLLSGES